MKKIKSLLNYNFFSKSALIFTLLISTALTQGFAQTKKNSSQVSQRDKFVAEVKKYVGCPYEYGSVGPDTFDCSGLVYYTAQKSVQVQLPRTAKAIYNSVTKVADGEKEVGDLLFFKTTYSGSVSHIGIYIGNNQFISALSDGPNSGVVVSSLNQDYWKNKYVGAGQFLPSGRQRSDPAGIENSSSQSEIAAIDNNEAQDNSSGTKESNGTTQETGKENNSSSTKKDETRTGTKKPAKKENFTQKVNFDASVFYDWSLISTKQFVFRYRGIDALLHASYKMNSIQPGIGLDFRFNTGLQVFQMPIVLSLTVNDYFRVYAGPVINFKNAVLIDTDKEIKGSVFPGIIGTTFSTPKLKIKDVGIQVVQDISWTVYNNSEGSALPFNEALASGLVLYTGIRVSVPLSKFF